ncbi:MAG: dodecin domain-containing protein [Clostridia bacterium]|nr:dodecin domain-containing protein [Clostridia bacterium]
MKSEKHIKITGYSNLSWKDAIVRSIEEASKTLENLTEVKVLSQSAKIQSNKIIEYSVDLEIIFQIQSAEPKLISSDDSDSL